MVKIWFSSWIEKASEHRKAGITLYELGLYRDSISRLYYATFSLMVAVCGKPPGGGWKHKGILKPFLHWLYKIGNPLSAEELSLLKEFYEKRRRTDYTTKGITSEVIKEYINLTNRLFEVIDDNRKNDS